MHFFGVFDQYAQTNKIGGDIVAGLTVAVDIIFCFGFAFPTPQILAVRPRSIGMADMCDKFVISCMEAPMQPTNQTMEAWTPSLRNA